MDASLSFSFMARPNVTMSASKPPQKMHIRAFGMEPFKGAMVAESPVTTSAPTDAPRRPRRKDLKNEITVLFNPSAPIVSRR